VWVADIHKCTGETLVEHPYQQHPSNTLVAKLHTHKLGSSPSQIYIVSYWILEFMI